MPKSFRTAGIITALALALNLVSGPGLNPCAAQTNPSAKWEKDIHAFELSDLTNPPPQHAVLFAGASSIRKWTTLAQDFPNHKVINRGFGGSEIADSTAFADRIIIPCHPRLILLYAGDNDIALGKTPDRVCADYQLFVEKIHTSLPDTRILFIAIKPSPSRWKLHEKGAEVNRRIAAMKAPYLGFIDIYTPMLDAAGQPRPELFVPDMLHLNPDGYALWTKIVKPYLDEPASKN